jgi:GNAT superfamily N-acetyltransferase
VTATFSIRKAAPGDADAIARIWHSAWRDSHVGHVPDGLLVFRREEDFLARVPGRIDNMWVAESGDGAVVGFVAVMADELEQLFVERAARGTGVAAMLMDRGERELRLAGHRRAWLAVVAGNARARAFYARRGWRDMGPFIYQAETTAGPFAVPSHRYEKELES